MALRIRTSGGTVRDITTDERNEIRVSLGIDTAVAPGAVTGLAAGTATQTTQPLSWTAPTTGSAPITYQVAYRLGSSSGAYTDFGSPVSGTSATVTGLTANTAYDYRVTPINSAGPGTAATLDDVSTASSGGGATAPGAPTGVSGTAGNGQIAFTGTPPASNGGAAIDQYRITLSPGGATFTGSTPNITATGLTNGQAYTATMAARNSVGYGPESIASSAVTPSAGVGVPGAPVIGTATAGNGTVSVFFDPPASDGGSPILDYTAILSTGQTATGLSSPINVVGATNGSPVTATVRARNSAGQGTASAASNSVTPTAAPSMLSRYATVGDSNSMRIMDSFSGCTLSTSGQIGTVTMPQARSLLPGTRIITYSAGATPRPVYGEYVVLDQPSTTTFRYIFTGSDSATGQTMAVSFGHIQTDTGLATWALAYLRQRLNLVFNGAVGGETAANTLSLRLNNIIAKNPHVVTVMLGTNDITQGRTYAQITADMSAIYSALRAANIKIVAITCPPRVGGTSAQDLLASQLAQYTRDQVAANPSQMILVDAHALGITSGNPTGPARAETMWDGTVHFSADYARQVGKAVATALDSIVVADTRTVPSGVGGGNGVANPQFTDSNSDGTADGVTITMSGASGTPTVGPAASGAGNSQRLAVSASGAGQSGQIGLASIHSALTAGKKYRLHFTLSWNGSNIQAFLGGINLTVGGTNYIQRSITAFTGETYVGPYTEDGSSLRFMTDVFVCPASLTAALPVVQGISRASGGFSFAVSECFTEEVT